MQENLFLAGFMGAGKTTVGRKVAMALAAKFVDLDGEIEREEVMSITEIFRSRGEQYFRDLEHAKLKEICRSTGQVVALGGGVVCYERNRKLLGESGTVIVLTAGAGEIWKRIGGRGGRPLLAEGEAYEDMVARLHKRKACYDSAGPTVETTGLSPDEAAARVLQTLDGPDRASKGKGRTSESG